MQLQEVLKNVQDCIEKMVHTPNFKMLKTYMLSLSEVSLKENTSELLTDIMFKYIEMVINLSVNKTYRDQIRICRECFDILQEVITEKVEAIFVRNVTQTVFDIVIEEDVNSWCVKKELLKMFLLCSQTTSKNVRKETVNRLPNFYLFKIIDSISTYGDYDFQVTLIEVIFRMYGKTTILPKLTDLIPESEELSQSFANINGETFDEDVRNFLNILNETSGKVFSIVCSDVFLGSTKCGEPLENINGLWVDFNLSENVVSWYCIRESLTDGNQEDGDAMWTLLLFFVTDVEVVQIYRPPMSNNSMIYVKLKVPCISSFESNLKTVQKADNIKFIVSNNSKKTTTLLSKVLPTMFKHKFHHGTNTPKVSFGKKSVYKPLDVSVFKKTKSDSCRTKSDSCRTKSEFMFFTDQVEPTCTKSDVSSSRNGTTVLKIDSSSASTKCEVISILDSSVHSIGSSINLLSKRVQGLQESQYETVQMCPLQHSQEILKDEDCAKISSSQKHENIILSDTSSFNEETCKGIQILSGKCSRSNGNRKSIPNYRKIRNNDSSENSDNFETANENFQNELISSKVKCSQSVKQLTNVQDLNDLVHSKNTKTYTASIEENQPVAFTNIETGVFQTFSLEDVLENVRKSSQNYEKRDIQIKYQHNEQSNEELEDKKGKRKVFEELTLESLMTNVRKCSRNSKKQNLKLKWQQKKNAPMRGKNNVKSNKENVEKCTTKIFSSHSKNKVKTMLLADSERVEIVPPTDNKNSVISQTEEMVCNNDKITLVDLDSIPIREESSKKEILESVEDELLHKEISATNNTKNPISVDNSENCTDEVMVKKHFEQIINTEDNVVEEPNNLENYTNYTKDVIVQNGAHANKRIQESFEKIFITNSNQLDGEQITLDNNTNHIEYLKQSDQTFKGKRKQNIFENIQENTSGGESIQKDLSSHQTEEIEDINHTASSRIISGLPECFVQLPRCAVLQERHISEEKVQIHTEIITDLPQQCFVLLTKHVEQNEIYRNSTEISEESDLVVQKKSYIKQLSATTNEDNVESNSSFMESLNYCEKAFDELKNKDDQFLEGLENKSKIKLTSADEVGTGFSQETKINIFFQEKDLIEMPAKTRGIANVLVKEDLQCATEDSSIINKQTIQNHLKEKFVDIDESTQHIKAMLSTTFQESRKPFCKSNQVMLLSEKDNVNKADEMKVIPDVVSMQENVQTFKDNTTNTVLNPALTNRTVQESKNFDKHATNLNNQSQEVLTEIINSKTNKKEEVQSIRFEENIEHTKNDNYSISNQILPLRSLGTQKKNELNSLNQKNNKQKAVENFSGIQENIRPSEDDSNKLLIPSQVPPSLKFSNKVNIESIKYNDDQETVQSSEDEVRNTVFNETLLTSLANQKRRNLNNPNEEILLAETENGNTMIEQLVENDKMIGAKGNEGNKIFNQSLSTTMRFGKKRKLYNPKDLSYLENISPNKNKEANERNISVPVEGKYFLEPMCNNRIYKKNNTITGKHSVERKSKKFKCANSDVILNVYENQNISSPMESTLSKILSSFQKEAQTKFSAKYEGNCFKIEEKKFTQKKSATKRNTRQHKNAIIMDDVHLRDQLGTDQLESSLKLREQRSSNSTTSDEYILQNKKINVISNIQIKPKSSIVSKKQVQISKTCNPNKMPVVLKNITSNMTQNWIETGNPNFNYNETFTRERRCVLKYCYPMFKKLLKTHSDKSEEFKDIKTIYTILKKYA